METRQDAQRKRRGWSKKALTQTRWFYDLEAIKWDQPRCAVAISSAGDVQRWVGPQSFRQCAEFQQRVRGEWWAHAGGLYDHPLMFRHSQLPAEVILTGSNILKARATKRTGKKQLVFRDSFPRWQVALAKVGKAVGLEKMDVDREHLEKLTDAECVAYCERDTEILKRGTELQDAWLDQWGVQAMTSGTAAVKLFRVLDPDAWAFMSAPEHMVDPRVAYAPSPPKPTDDDSENLKRWRTQHAEWNTRKGTNRAGALDGVRGARTETRRVGLVEGSLGPDGKWYPVSIYDIHSSYPSQYAKADVPIGCEVDDSRDLDARGWLDWCTWTLPRLDKDHTAFELGADGRGHGEVSGYCTWEMAWELDRRGFNPQRKGIGWKCTGWVRDFAAGFCDELYRLKERGGAQAFFAKVTFNSLHGKLAESPAKFAHKLKREFWNQPAPDNWSVRKCYNVEPVVLPIGPWQQPIAGACILARARLTLNLAIEILENAGWQFYYCDTDSIHTNCPPEVFKTLLMLTGELGHWGLESRHQWVHYLAAKSYFCGPEIGEIDFNPKKIKFASKGMPKDQIKGPSANADDYWRGWQFGAAMQGNGVELTRGGLYRFRQGDKMGHAAELTRTLKPAYSKRTLKSDGWLEYD